MGKRSNFERIPKDLYRTWDPRAVPPLMPHLRRGSFYEPCAGAGDLIKQLQNHGMDCVGASDTHPQAAGIKKRDALKIRNFDADYIITNPPWTRSILHKMIERFRRQKPTWLLFDAGWMHTKQAAPYLPYCHTIVSLPRLRWIEDSAFNSKDDAAWYGFSAAELPTEFFGQEAS